MIRRTFVAAFLSVFAPFLFLSGRGNPTGTESRAHHMSPSHKLPPTCHTIRAERKRKRETNVAGKGVFPPPPPPPPPPWGGSAAAAVGKWRRRRMREVRRGRGSQHLPTFTARLHPPREGRGERGEGGGRTAKHGNERGPPHKVGKVVGPTPMSPPFIRCIFSSSGGGGAVLTRLQNERWVEMGSRQ